jgi:hypothetical protein
MLLSEGQMSDYKGAALMLDALPRAKALLGGRGHDADCFRRALAERDITACIPSKKNQNVLIFLCRAISPTPQDRDMCGRLKDWSRIHTRHNRCAHTFMSAIRLAATFIFWINQ